LQASLDQMLAPVTKELSARVGAVAGLRLLDIGCGTGDTTLMLAEAVGPQGHVTGLDISAPMLGLARTRAAETGREGRASIDLILGDAATHAFPPAAADLVFSRFGVMFFGDPTAAFANIRAGMRTGARLAFAAWRPPADNPWVAIPQKTVAPYLPPQDAPAPGLPGQFAFGDANHVTRILEGAGFTDIVHRVHPVTQPVGRDLDEAVDRASNFGSTGRALAAADAPAREAARAALRATLAAYVNAKGMVVMRGSVWITTARNA
jgi:SAM-dependent methyltransferase